MLTSADLVAHDDGILQNPAQSGCFHALNAHVSSRPSPTYTQRVRAHYIHLFIIHGVYTFDPSNWNHSIWTPQHSV